MKPEIYNARFWVRQSDARYLKKVLGETAQAAGFTVLGVLEHAFEPFGYTALWLLAESHLAVHTFPEAGRAYVELSSCNARMYEDFIKLIAQHLEGIPQSAEEAPILMKD